MYRLGTTPFAHPRGSLLYLCMLFDCYVIGGLFVGVLASLLLIRDSRARLLGTNLCKT